MKHKIDAIIPCAGNNKRMHTKLPKALLKINGEHSLNHQLYLLKNYIDKFYIIINDRPNEEIKYIKRIDKKYLNNIIFVTSQAGSGDGRAILDGLNAIYKCRKKLSNIFICWGDIYFKNDFLFKKLKDYFSNNIKVKTIMTPLKLIRNPYVTFVPDKNGNIKNVLFQRRNQFVDYGYQDLGIFFINYNFIRKILIIMSKKIKNNHELNFLDCINIMYKKKKFIHPYVLNFNPQTYSFNKINELNNARYHAKK